MESKHRDEDRVDVTLRRGLEPNPLAVERIVRRALNEGRAPSRVRWWPRLAIAAGLVALVVFLIPEPPEPPTTGADEPARISISNAEGYVTISSAAGSKWILISGDDS